MNLRKILFASAFAVNMLAYFITLYLLSLGYEEAGVVSRYIISSKFYILFQIFVFAMLYLILIYFPDKSRDKVWLTASYWGCLALFVALFIDFFHDLLIFLEEIF